MTSDAHLLTVIYQRAEHGWTTASIPAVPGTISTGRNRREALDNVLDALRGLLASLVEVPQGATREHVGIALEVARGQDRSHDR